MRPAGPIMPQVLRMTWALASIGDRRALFHDVKATVFAQHMEHDHPADVGLRDHGRAAALAALIILAPGPGLLIAVIGAGALHWLARSVTLMTLRLLVAAAVLAVVPVLIVAAGTAGAGTRLSNEDRVVVQGIPSGADGAARVPLADCHDLPHPQQRGGRIAADEPLEHHGVARRASTSGRPLAAGQLDRLLSLG